MSINHTLCPSIYVACLAAYNSGYLHGCWIDATQDANAINKTICEMLASSPVPDAEEWEIHDYEGFGELSVDGFACIDSISQYGKFIEQHGELGAAMLDYYSDLSAAQTALDDQYHGEWESELAFAENMFNEVYAHDIPDHLQDYIDYQTFAHDLFVSDYMSFESRGNVHIFSCY